MKILFALALLVSPIIGVSDAIAELFKFAKNSTDVRFICGAGLTGIEGRFPDVYGQVVVDDDGSGRARAHVTIKTASLTTGSAFLDAQLRGRHYFYVARHPTIQFDGRATTTDHRGQASMRGTLSIRDIEKPISFPVTYIRSRDPSGRRAPSEASDVMAGDVFSARFPILRSDYGMGGWDIVVPNRCEVEIRASLRK